MAAQINSLPEEERERLLEEISDEDAEELLYDWDFWRRESQTPPSWNWHTWLILSGRGFGKTRVGAEWVKSRAYSGKYGRIALVAETAADARDVLVEGESGILACSPPWFYPHYEPSKRRLTWPNGAVATTYSGDEPDQLRGPQHDSAWADELAKWQYASEAWDNLEFGLRIGPMPQSVVTTTPRPLKVVRSLKDDPHTAVTTGSSYENIDNLSPTFVERVVRKYEGTRLGRQELHGQILDDVPGALWGREMIDDHRLPASSDPDCRRVVVAIDPATTSGEDSDETGIVVAGLGVDGRGYVLGDRSCRLSPEGWAQRAIEAYEHFGADRIIAEVNQGGDMVERVLRSRGSRIPYRKVHASRGKRVRAEPVAALYEQGKVSHVGSHKELEDEMVSFLPEGSDGLDDRVDALVYALSELMLSRHGGGAKAKPRGW